MSESNFRLVLTKRSDGEWREKREYVKGRKKSDYMKEYHQRPEVIEKHRRHSAATNRKRYKTDPCYRIQHDLRSRFREFLEGKNMPFKEMVGCSPAFLMGWLESKFHGNMNWDNHGSVWHIDHVVPLSWFPTTLDWQKVAWHYSNLQPLPAKENIRKHNYHAG
jgi:hypothetical protein